MRITPLDIQQKQFSTRFKGFDMEEVDSFLELIREEMEELLREQRRNYDYIIIDGPPVLLVSDAKVLAGLVDATVLVFNAGAT